MIKIYKKDSIASISDNIKLEEFRCKCDNKECKSTPVSTVLMDKFEKLRKECGNLPIKITSGHRCQVHNYEVGGTLTSKHLYGLAMDLKPPKGMDLIVFESIAWDIGFGIVLPYTMYNFIHVDVRNLD